MNSLRVASVPFDLRATTHDDFWSRVERWCQEAARERADVVLFPEYFALSYFLAEAGGTFKEALVAWPRLCDEFFSRFKNLSREHQMWIVGGTVPVSETKGLVNRAHVFSPTGEVLFQDKRFMTRFEDEEWSIQSGTPGVTTFTVKGARCGIAICFDVEFPLYVEDLVKQDVDVILVPSCTDDVHGFWRVRHCAEARAIETQSYAVISYTVGGDPRHPEINVHYGRAVFATPCDVGFPEGGVLCEGPLNEEGVTVAELNLESLRRVRANGTVLNRQLGRNAT